MEYWENRYKCTYSVRSYLSRYNAYSQYLNVKNKIIFKSVFGKKNFRGVEKEINKWFNICLGAYCIIKEKEIHIEESKIYG